MFASTKATTDLISTTWKPRTTQFGAFHFFLGLPVNLVSYLIDSELLTCESTLPTRIMPPAAMAKNIMNVNAMSQKNANRFCFARRLRAASRSASSGSTARGVGSTDIVSASPAGSTASGIGSTDIVSALPAGSTASGIGSTDIVSAGWSAASISGGTDGSFTRYSHWLLDTT